VNSKLTYSQTLHCNRRHGWPRCAPDPQASTQNKARSSACYTFKSDTSCRSRAQMYAPQIDPTTMETHNGEQSERSAAFQLVPARIRICK